MVLHIQPLKNWCSEEKNHVSTLQTSRQKLPSLSREDSNEFQLFFRKKQLSCSNLETSLSSATAQTWDVWSLFWRNHQLCWSFESPTHKATCWLFMSAAWARILSPSEVPLVFDLVGVEPQVNWGSSSWRCKKQVLETRTNRIWWTHTSKIWNETILATFCYIPQHVLTSTDFSWRRPFQRKFVPGILHEPPNRQTTQRNEVIFIRWRRKHWSVAAYVGLG